MPKTTANARMDRVNMVASLRYDARARSDATAEMLIFKKCCEVAGAAWKTLCFLDKSFSRGRYCCQERLILPRKYSALNRVRNRAQVEHVDQI
jgi:hypothetical protein